MSFDHHLDFKKHHGSKQVPITKRKYSDNLLGYLVVDWTKTDLTRTDVEKKFSILKIILVAKDKLDANLTSIGTVAINDLFDCFTTSEEIEDERVKGCEAGHIKPQPGLKPKEPLPERPAKLKLPRRQVMLNDPSIKEVKADITVNIYP